MSNPNQPNPQRQATVVRKPAEMQLRDIRIDNITDAAAAQLCRDHPDIAGRLIMAILAQNTAALPGTTFVKREDGVYLKKQKQTIRLTEREGHLLPMSKPVGKGKDKGWVTVWDLSMNGLRRLNELPALQIIRPEFVIVEGVKQMNPYIQVDRTGPNPSKMPEVVYSRCLCVGYSPMGSLVATDAMIRLDVNIYLLENIQSKMKRLDAQAHRLGIYGSADEPPTDDTGKKLVGRWRFMPLHSVGGIGLWINLAAGEAQEILQDHTTRVKYIERLAQSFAERNALKSHPAIPKAINAENGVAMVTVTGWTTDFNRGEIERLRELIEKNQIEDFRTRDGKNVDRIAVEIDQPTEEDIASMNEEAEGQRGVERAESGDEDTEATEGAGHEKAEEPVEQVDLLPRATEIYSSLVGLGGRASAKKVLSDAGAPSLEEATAEQLTSFLKLAQDILDSKK